MELFLDESRRGATAGFDGGGVATLAAFSLLIFSLLSRISDFLDSMIAAAFGNAGLALSPGAMIGSVALGIAKLVLLSSTSPSSTSPVTVGFGVGTPWELVKY